VKLLKIDFLDTEALGNFQFQLSPQDFEWVEQGNSYTLDEKLKFGITLSQEGLTDKALF
jgi:hypothetical protein